MVVVPAASWVSRVRLVDVNGRMRSLWKLVVDVFCCHSLMIVTLAGGQEPNGNLEFFPREAVPKLTEPKNHERVILPRESQSTVSQLTVQIQKPQDRCNSLDDLGDASTLARSLDRRNLWIMPGNSFWNPSALHDLTKKYVRKKYHGCARRTSVLKHRERSKFFCNSHTEICWQRADREILLSWRGFSTKFRVWTAEGTHLGLSVRKNSSEEKRVLKQKNVFRFFLTCGINALSEEVEVANSQTSQPTQGRRFPEFQMLDAKAASSLKKIIPIRIPRTFSLEG